MAFYYVDNRPQPNGDHEVHVRTCRRFPGDNAYLGEYQECAPAVAQAERTHSPANGCLLCCRACHRPGGARNAAASTAASA